MIGGATVCGAICLYGIPLPCLGSKFSTVEMKIDGSQFERLRSATLKEDDDEVNSTDSVR